MSRVPVLCLLAACAADHLTPPPVVAYVGQAQAWSGGHARVVVARPATATALVVVGRDTVTATLTDAFAYDFAVPDTSGPVLVQVLDGTTAVVAGTLQVRGYTGWKDGPMVDGFLHVRPGDPPAAYAIHDGQVVLIDFRDGSTTPLVPDTGLISDCFVVPVPSLDDRTVIPVSHPGCTVRIARRQFTGAFVDSGPMPDYYWPVVRLSPGHWLVNYKYYTQSFTRDAAGRWVGGPMSLVCTQPVDFALSPRRDRALPLNCGTPSGILHVFDANGDVAFQVGTVSVEGAAFDESGDILYAALRDSSDRSERLHALDATDGRRLAAVSLDYYSDAVAVDPGRPWLYAATVDTASQRVAIQVFDRRTMTRVATLRRPLGAEGLADEPFPYLPFTLVVDGPNRILHLVLGGSRNSGQHPIRSYRFSLMP